MNRIELKVNHLIKTNRAQYCGGKDISYIAQYLRSLGIKEENIPSFIEHPRPEDEDNPSNLSNMREAVDVAWSKITHGAKCFVIVDSDCDGYTSASILIGYLRMRFPSIDISYALHPGKEHGIVLQDIPEDRDLIFVPDAGSNNYEEQRQLISKGKTVIILDHHEVDNYENTGAILVNNQTSAYFSNKNLSGAGVVYMFTKMMDEVYFPAGDVYKDFRDLAAVGIIADAMNMSSLGNNFLAYYGLKNINNKFIKTLAEKQERGIKNPNSLTKIDVAFYIAPVINGVIRSGSVEDKEAVFKAMSNNNNDEIITTEWRGVQRQETIYQYAVRLAANAKSRQDSAKKKSFEWLCEKIESEGHDKDNLIIATLDTNESKKVSPTITGLIAMELVKKFNRPALVLRETDYNNIHCFGGSGRNGSFFGLPDLKSFIHQSGVTYGEGHSNAFGAFLTADEIERLRKYANEKLNPLSFENIYEVDYIFKDKYDIDSEMLYQMASYDDLWGNSIPQPKFAFTVDYCKTDIFIMGKDRSSYKIKCGDVSFVGFKDNAVAEKLLSITNGTAVIVGRPQLNSWQGNVSIQVMVDDIDIVEREEQQRPKSLFDLI